MKILRYPFGSFFQPHELENYLGRKTSIRTRVAWAHLALALVWFSIYLVIFYLAFASTYSSSQEALIVGLLTILIIYAATIIVGLVGGGLSKRDLLLNFVVSTYWSFLVSIIWFILVIFERSNYSEDLYSPRWNQQILNSIGLVLLVGIIGAIIVTLKGITKGIRPAFFMALAFAIAITAFFWNESVVTPKLRIYENPQRGTRVMVLETRRPHRESNGILPFLELKRDTTLLELDPNPTRQQLTRATRQIEGSPSEYALYTLGDQDINTLLNEGKIPQPIADKLRPLTGKFFDSPAEFFSKVTDTLQTNAYNRQLIEYAGRRDMIDVDHTEYFPADHDDYNLARLNDPTDPLERPIVGAVLLPNGDTLRLDKGTNDDYSVARVTLGGKIVWRKSLNYQPDPNIWVEGNIAYLYTPQGLTALKLDTTNPTGEEFPVDDNFDWYSSHFGVASNLVSFDGSPYSVSPSGYLFTARASDTQASIFKESIYAEQIGTTTIKLLFYFLVFYLIGVTFLLCMGLYRLPMYAVESLVQFVVLVKTRIKPATFSQNVRYAPLLFDHVSSLRLPFGKAFLSRIAKKDERQCAELLLYMLDKTQQVKLAARISNSFFIDHKDLTFEYLYRLLKPENQRVFERLSARSQPTESLGELLQSYAGLLAPETFVHPPKNSRVGYHAALLKKYADSNYRYATELFLTYEVFQKFYDFKIVEDIANADLVLAELQKISLSDTLNVNLANTFGVITELASDLKNYDVVDSFRDKQYYLSEARIKLYEITRRAQKDFGDPEATILLEIIERWQGLVIAESKALRGPAELELAVGTKNLSSGADWNNVLISVRNVGLSPAENISVALLENENLSVLEGKRNIRLLGTGEGASLEFNIQSKGNPSELRLYFDTTFDDFERKSKVFTFADVISLTTTVEEFKRIPNPYVVGTPLQSDKVFFGRKKVLDFAVENLSAGEQNNALIFFGQRRIGKSSLLYRIQDSALKTDFLFVYIDCQGFADADTGKLLYRICESIQSAASKNQIALEAPDLEKFKANTFIELDSYLNKTERALESKKLVLMFDEYEYLEYKVKDGSVSAEIFNKLRNLMQHRNKNIAFIFVGTHRLQELTSNYWSFLFNTALYYEIGSLGKPEARALITDPIKGYLRYDELAIEKILRITGLHPYFIQGSCRAIVNYCNEKKKNYVTLTDINEVMRDAVESSTAHVKYLYQDYANEKEQAVLTFLSHVTDDSKLFATAREISRYASENNFDYEPRLVQEILSSLKIKRLVREDGEERGDLFGFEYEFLRIWIKEHIKIRHGALLMS